MTQPAWLPVPLVAFALLERRPGAICWAVFGATLVFLPWWVRNAMLFGEFVPLTTSAGLSLWVATFRTYEAVGAGAMNELASAALTGRTALAAISADPAAYLHGVAKWASRALALDSEMSAFVGIERARWIAASANASNAAWAVLLVWSAAKQRRVDRVWGAFALGWLVGVSLGVWLEFSQRHRAFAVPLLLLWAFAPRAGGAPANVDRELLADELEPLPRTATEDGLQTAK